MKTTPTALSRCSRGSEPAPRGQRGLSLVEIMVAMAIGLVIVLIATTLYMQGASNFGFRMGQSENLSNGRYALGTLDSEFTKAGFRRDPTQSMEEAFPEDASASKNGCKFARGQAVYVTDDGELCMRYQARDNDEKDCAGSAAGIAGLKAYEAPPSPALGAGLFVEKYFLQDGSLVCQAGSQEDSIPVADGVQGIHFEYGVGKVTDSQAERRVESFKTDTPGADEAIRSLRYAVLLASTAERITGGMETTACTRWAELGGEEDRCDTSKGQLYQIANGSLTLRNLMP